MSYKQTLWKEIKDVVNPKILSKKNRYKKWEYGYNSDYDFIVISKTGKIGQIIEIQNLRIALPAINEPFKRSEKKQEQYWEKQHYPKELSKIKSRFDWDDYPNDFKEKWYNYIDEEFKRREQGYWFYNNGNPVYITGTHYMYLQWSKIDVGAPDYREANSAKQTLGVMECVTLKTDGLVSPLCHQQNLLTKQRYLVTHDSVFFLKPDLMLKKCLQTKSYQYPLTTHFSLNLSKMEWIVQKLNSHIEYLLQSLRDVKLKQKKN
jgi:hypothetical protein